MLDVACPACGEVYHVKQEHVGKNLRCRRCERVFEIAAPRAASQPSAAGARPAAGPAAGAAPRGPQTAAPYTVTPAGGAAHPITVTDQSFERMVLQSPVPVVVDFWAAWCGPCRAIAPAVEQLALEYGGRVTFAKLNADENPRTTSRYGVMGLPTLVVFKDGREVQRLVGAHPKASIKRVVDLATA